MLGQLWKIMCKQSSDTSSPNTSPIMVKNEIDVMAIELPKLGQSIECKLINDDDSKWRKLNIISRASKATGKKKCNECKPFWLDFEPGVLEWKASEIRPRSDVEHTFGDEENTMISSSDHNLETAKKRTPKLGQK